MDATYETPTLSQDLRVGDVILSATLGGCWDKPIDRVNVYPDAVDAWIGTTRLHFLRDEMLAVLREERPRLATVHPLFRGIVKAASEMGSGPRPSGEPG